MKRFSSWNRKIALLVLLLIGLPMFIQLGKAESFADPAFTQVWERSDKAIAEGTTNRTWLWGPQPKVSYQEPYAQSPGGMRLVQYFDKSRMEITSPSSNKNDPWFVTNGLLTKELVTGRLQLGDSNYETRHSSNIPVAGDPGNPGPNYSSFSRLVTIDGDNRASRKTGIVKESVDRAGKIGQWETTLPDEKLARYSYYVTETGHNIPNVFWDWLQNLPDTGWLFAMGFPISEPYWTHFTVGGIEREVLVQLYERRVLTYNPSNSSQWQVEMGNIGQHYLSWRYGGESPTLSPTPTSSSSNLPGSSSTPVPTTYTITPSLTSTRGSSISPTPTSTQGSGNTTTTPTPTSTQGSGSTTTTPAPTSTQGSGNTTTPTPTSTQGNGGTTTTPAPGSTQGSGTAPTATATPLVINEEEKKFLDLINQYRNANNLSLLRVDDSLQRAARWMSEDMANNNRFSHIDSQGRDYPKRLTDFGYTAKPQNETILAGGSSAQSAFDFWTGSAEYNAIILSPKYKAFGIGYAYNMNSTYKFYWTANFGGM